MVEPFPGRKARSPLGSGCLAGEAAAARTLAAEAELRELHQMALETAALKHRAQVALLR